MNKEYAEGTVLRYERTARYLKEFISEQYKLADIPFAVCPAAEQLCLTVQVTLGKEHL